MTLSRLRKPDTPRLLQTARRVSSDEPAELRKFIDSNLGNIADERDGSPVFMAKSGRELRYTAERWPKVRFSATRERHH